MSENEIINPDSLFDSEYDDVLTLSGIDDPDQMEELLGRIWRNPASKKKLAKMLVKRKPAIIGGQTTSRDDFQKRFSMLPKDTRKKLLTKDNQLVDTALYIVKDISGSKSAKMLQDDDNKKIGLSNISGGKLEKGNFFTLKAIQLLYGKAAAAGDYGNVEFDVLPAFICNGEFEFTANGSVLIPSMSCEVFNTKGKSDVRAGYFEIVNPKMLETQQLMDFEVEWPVSAPDMAFLKLVMIGTSVAKY